MRDTGCQAGLITALLMIVAHDVVAGGFDKEPPVVLARGNPAYLDRVSASARKCGVQAVWIWNNAL